MLLLQESVFSECGISASFRWDEQGKCSPRPPDPATEVLVDRIGWTMQIGVVVAAIDPIRFRLAVDVVQAYQQIDQGFAGAGHLDGLGRPASSPWLSPMMPGPTRSDSASHTITLRDSRPTSQLLAQSHYGI